MKIVIPAIFLGMVFLTGCLFPSDAHSLEDRVLPIVNHGEGPGWGMWPNSTFLSATEDQETPGDFGEIPQLNSPDVEVYSKPSFTALYIPVIGMKADKDKSEPNLGVEFDADLKAGSGWGGRIGIRSYESGSNSVVDIGLLYLTTQHDEKFTDSHVRTDAVYIEMLFVGTSNNGPVRFTGSAGFGVGGAGFNFSQTFDDTRALAGEVRTEIGAELWKHLELQLGGGGFLWGYPTETVGYGGFVTVSCGLRF